MALESGTKISNLVQDNPPGTDQVAQGDDHIRLIKGVLKASFPSDVAVQIPEITGNAGKTLSVSEDGLSTVWSDDTTGDVYVWEWVGSTFDNTTLSLLKDDWYTPRSATSKLFITLTAEVKAWTDQGKQEVYFQLKDVTNGVMIGHEARAVAWQGTSGRIENSSYFTIQTVWNSPPSTAFEIGIFGRLLTTAGDSGAGIRNSVLTIVEA